MKEKVKMIESAYNVVVEPLCAVMKLDLIGSRSSGDNSDGRRDTYHRYELVIPEVVQRTIVLECVQFWANQIIRQLKEFGVDPDDVPKDPSIDLLAQIVTAPDMNTMIPAIRKLAQVTAHLRTTIEPTDEAEWFQLCKWLDWCNALYGRN